MFLYPDLYFTISIRVIFSVRGFYKKRVNSLLWPYLIFSTFYFFYPIIGVLLVPAVYKNFSGLALVGLSEVQVFGAYLISLATGGTSQMWFILLILQLYLLYPLIVIVYNRTAKHPNVVIYALAMLFVVQILFIGFASNIVGPLAARNLFVSCIFYFVLGVFVCDHYDSTKNRITRIRLLPLTTLVALTAMSYGATNYHAILMPSSPIAYMWLLGVAQPLYGVLLIVFFLKICIQWREPHSILTRSMQRIGEDSFGIFLTHIFYLEVFSGVLIRLGLGYTDRLYYPVVVVLTLVACYVTVHLIYRLPLSSIIIGRPRKSTTG
ncbi:MAG: acyltransferase family protein [Halobacteriota archaeon]